ncbi:hypothetical protein BD309DRAFT_862069 [Dichomitus squalens]|uniref:Uncharacterized protein n=1 Tax=Dichomitus squalens TaxID=114155 RepID=A0A4Q9PJR8_9APHY|nr:hypothetical protein BD309DRAFT_862069 [Dichomitus squalens]TBU54334.1 hypothetical protein BD310DRAFT_858738 [Dichomitus squalens]
MQPPPSPTKRADRYSPASSSVPTPLSRQDTTDTRGSQRSADGESSTQVGSPGLDRHERNGHAGELTESPSLISAKLPPVDPKDDTRLRDSSWATRNGYEDRNRLGPLASRSDARNGSNPVVVNEDRGLPQRDQRPFERERERERERDRDRSREREHERDADRDRRLDHGRFRDREDRKDDRRIEDRARPSDDRRPPNGTRYEPRHPLRRYDSKASESSLNPGRRDDRGPPETRPPPRNLGEERAIVRPPLNAAALPPRSVSEERRAPPPSGVDNRAARPPLPIIDDRRPLRSPERPSPRVIDGHRSPPVLLDRPGRPDDRRLPPLPATDRPAVIVDDRRRPPSPAAIDRAPPRSLDDRLAPISVPAALPSDRQVRPGDEHRPSVPAVPGDRPPFAAVSEDRRPPAPTSAPADRPRPGEDRRPVLEERVAHPHVPAPIDSLPARPPAEDRGPRPVHPIDRSTRPALPLEERISRTPLQERLGKPAAPPRPDDRPAPRLEERLSRSGNGPPSLEERLSNPPAADSRPPRPLDDRPLRPPPSLERPVGRLDDRTVLAEPARTAALSERPPPHHDDRHFPQPGRFARPASPALSDRGHPPSRPPYRAASIARDEPSRSFRPISPMPARPPSRSDVRDFRPDPRDRDRVESRAPYRPDLERYPPERRPSDLMDVDPPPRFSDTRPPYRRPSPPPAASYPPRAGERDRTWVPAGEAPAYRDPEPSSRPPADPLSYPPREWRDSERRPYGDDLQDRSWDRSREYERESRFPDRDAPPPAWETREERERRGTYPAPADLPPPARSGYVRDDRAPARYPPVEPPSSYSRVRPRSPSPGPLRRGTAGDDLRPPLKRPRDSSYPPPASGGYYPPADRDEPRGPPPSDYPPRLRTPPPASGGYYDDPRYNTSPGRDRDYIDSRDRDPGYGYERRDPPGRMPPSRSPPPYGRPPAYGRDDRRYSIPPRG